MLVKANMDLITVIWWPRKMNIQLYSFKNYPKQHLIDQINPYINFS